ncbi:glycerol-3-phosphate dehydrogenase [Dimargaris verticillata]|uniref:Glycerol-3-phosphate dehydrogenase [NAD(+)] n=1 Tax=Dimargaris verticillata TaxID=2761393 RepID=A0A9W8B311_9FUNG|nr:glycerol-3-phosphate dehydrogenase [Dimargaris verticillata]
MTQLKTHILFGTQRYGTFGGALPDNNRGSVVAKIIGNNVMHFKEFNPQVKMWVFEETVNGRPLTELINTQHENVKYLPGIKLPRNVIAEPNLAKAAQDATILIFVLPHQFVRGACKQLKGHIMPGCKAISLIKGLDTDTAGLNLLSNVISNSLDIDVSVLSGANIANEVAQEKFCETTIGYRNRHNGQLFYELFNTPYFRVSIVNDPNGVEMCGALKNVVAVGAGIVDGLGLGDNTKAAIIRIGLMEMIKFAKLLDPSVKDSTFYESCGVADVITSCAGGRNRRVAKAFAETGKPLDKLEKEMLHGQKLQGTSTCKELIAYLRDRRIEDE